MINIPMGKRGSVAQNGSGLAISRRKFAVVDLFVTLEQWQEFYSWPYQGSICALRDCLGRVSLNAAAFVLLSRANLWYTQLWSY